MSRVVACPRCKKSTVYSDKNPYRPFCSERCRLIDLGQWAEEEYRVPLAPEDVNEEILLEETDEDELPE